MKNVKKIKVGGVYYDVETSAHVSAIEGCWGTCSYGESRINIAPGLSDERYDDVLIHELTHAIFYEAGFSEQDEDMVNRIAKVLHQVLRDNHFK